ncbi:MAG: type II toxin-antitoxin system YafQ family toxin [Bacteroidetes bacterium]|nr:type II toxin-antitoxin system YafQ family toxin [Bacteroidota bacterium]
MYLIVPRNDYERDVKALNRSEYELEEMDEVVRTLAESDEYALTPEFIEGYYVHELDEPYFGVDGIMDLHLTDDEDNWVLLYRIQGQALWLIRTGTHDSLGLSRKRRKQR